MASNAKSIQHCNSIYTVEFTPQFDVENLKYQSSKF
jgi:hypothetical protein